MKHGSMTDGIFLLHIVDALAEIVEFAAPYTDYSAFTDDRKAVLVSTARF